MNEVIEITREDVHSVYKKWVAENEANPADFMKREQRSFDEYVDGCVTTFLEYLQEVKK
jgi:hypothetical protein